VKNSKRVYIALDLTRKQQQVGKDLRTNLKKFKDKGGHENLRIKGGKVIKNGPGNQIVVLYQPAIGKEQ